MAVGYGKGDRGAATVLHSRLVRWRAGACQACGATPGWDQLDAAHIIGRGWSWTRTWSPNLLALCRGCHRHFDSDKAMTVKVLKALTDGGLEEFLEALRARRDSGPQRLNWAEERLTVEREAWMLGDEFAAIEMSRKTLRKGSVETFKENAKPITGPRCGYLTGSAADRGVF